MCESYANSARIRGVHANVTLIVYGFWLKAFVWEPAVFSPGPTFSCKVHYTRYIYTIDPFPHTIYATFVHPIPKNSVGAQIRTLLM
jgi:hypothetical protein